MFFRKRSEEVTKKNIFAYICNRQKAIKLSVLCMCKALHVTESGYYKWKRNRHKVKKWQLVLTEMHTILEEHEDNDNYGVTRMKIALKQKGIKCSRSTVLRIMRRGNLIHKSRKSPDGLTKADKKAQKCEDLVKQDFSASKPNEKWLTDITQITCKDGTLYIAPVLDCFAGEIISVAMDDNMKKELCIRAIQQAYEKERPKPGFVAHSDPGSQYTSHEYKRTIASLHGVQSMGGVGACYDNARMESFFATLKKEKLYRIDTKKLTIEQVKTIVWRYIMVYYNRLRINTFNEGGYPPSVYRQKSASIKAA
jgi:integrase family protein